MEEIQKKSYNPICVRIILLLIISIFILAKAFITTQISLTDEAHYVATAYRFFKGDAVLVDDWSPEQMNGVLLLPFIYLFKVFWASTEGIMLYFRLIYLFIKLLIFIFAWYRLEKYGRYGAYGFFGALLFYLVTPFNIENLSYNTIPLMMVFLIGTIILTSRNRKYDYILCGIALAIAVLAQPYVILLYFFGLMGCLIYSVVKCRGGNKNFEIWKDFGWLTIGAALIALIFSVFVFSRTNINSIANNIGFILNEPDHGVTGQTGIQGYITKLRNTADIFVKSYYKIIIYNLVNLFFIVFLTWKTKKKRTFAIIAQLCTICCLILSCIMLLGMKSFMIENEIFIPFIGYALSQMVIGRRRCKESVFFLFIGFYILAISLGTNTGVHAPNAALSIVAIFSVIVFGKNAEADAGKYRLVVRYGILLTIACAFTLRIIICWDEVYCPERYRCKIERGPLRGTYTTETIYDGYNQICKDLDLITWKREDILFCGSETPIAYLYADVNYGIMGTPFFYMDYERYQQYLSLHPKKNPTVIYYHTLTGGKEEKQFIENCLTDFDIIIMENRVLLRKKEKE